MKATQLFTEFFESEKAGGLLLIGCAVISLGLANSVFGESYTHVWQIPVLSKPLQFWINDGFMALFFLLMGLEIEREIYVGEFSEIKNATLPILAAAGGMIIPAGIHFAFNHGTPYQDGFGIPMATDIAFSLGILSLLGKGVPIWIKVFLTALAIMDDLGAILIIAFFYSSSLSWGYLGMAMIMAVIMIVCNRMKIHAIWVYLLAGTGIGYCLYHTGIHPTIAGVLVAFAIPFGDGSERSPSYRLQHLLHKPVAFFILPLFALANTAILISGESFSQLLTANSIGIFLGLVIGKPMGIYLFCMAGIALRICTMPKEAKKKYIAGAGMLAGIGFTMSIFITLLAFDDTTLVDSSKLIVMIASLVAGTMGYFYLKHVIRVPA